MDIEKLIKTYGKQFEKEVYPKLPDSQYGNLESLLLYCVIRDMKPKVVPEFGTETNGRSTFIIHKALVDTGRVFIHAMFDMPSKVEEAVVNLYKNGIDVSTGSIWALSGPIEHTIWLFEKRIPLQDVEFAFIDADHSYDFAKGYVERIIKWLTPSATIHIHDVNVTEEKEAETTPDSEEQYLRELMESGELPMESLISLDSISRFPKYLPLWKRIQKVHSFIGDPYPTEFPYTNSAQYFRKI